MRMWMIPPQLLCRQHLLGEHNEIHKFVGYANKGNSVEGWLRRGYINPAMLQKRHDVLVEEMSKRGYRHLSPLQELTREDLQLRFCHVDLQRSVVDLCMRCRFCRERLAFYTTSVNRKQTGIVP